MDNANYRHIVAQIKKSSLLSHHIYPNHNLLSIDTLCTLSDANDFPGDIPCYVPFEYEVKYSSVFFPGSNFVDDASDLVKKKLRWEKKLNSMELYNLTSVIESVKKIRKNKQTKLSTKVKKYIQHFYNDPEPYFNGSYNWLYTGGSIASMEENKENVLICADYSAKKQGFSFVKLSESLDKVEYKNFYQLKTSSPVLQITCKANCENVIVCVRQKNRLSVFRVDGEASLMHPTKLWRKKAVNNKLITSSDISANCQQVAISDTNYDVHVVDVESGAKTFGYDGNDFVPESVADRWGQVSLADLGLFVAFRNSLHVFDLRDADARPKLLFNPSSSTNYCEGISNVTKCINSNYIYLATNHSLLQVDLRNQKPVQKWTHMMSNPPQFASSVQLGEQELLILQSWKVDEVVGVTNDRVASNCFLSKSLPCLLRSVKESLRLTRCQATCLNPLLVKRVNFAITGVKCLKSNRGEVFMFSQNSAGDVFLSKIGKRVNDISTDAKVEEGGKEVESMKLWNSHLEESPPKAVDKTLRKVDMSHVLQGVQSFEEKEKPWEKPKKYWKCHEIYAPESLCFYRDALSQNFLKVWGYGPEESDQEEEIFGTNEKVLEWMAKI